MAEEYGARGVKFAFIYTREAHPGEKYGHHQSFEQKLRNARDMVDAHNIRRPMLVDDLDGKVHRAYGSLPNMAYIIGGGGKIVYRAAWTDAGNLRLVLDSILESRDRRNNGEPMRPFYVEWEASVALDRVKFVEMLLNDVGPRAVPEYIAAIEATLGAAAARPARKWWEAQQSPEQ